MAGAAVAHAVGCGNLAGEDLFGYPDRLASGGAGAEGGAGGDGASTSISSSSSSVGPGGSSVSSSSASSSAVSSSAMSSSSSGVACPNGTCDAGETPESCPDDCPAGCDHQVCEQGGPLTIGCGDPCVDMVCGQDDFCCNMNWDGQCIGEANDLCGDVCCGDGSCDGESCTSCPQDCGACTCGDGNCSGETCESCADDCGACPVLCPHTACFVGEPLEGDGCFDPCVTEVCAADPGCCMGNGDGWDDDCKDEAQTLCGGPDPCVAAVCGQMPSCCTGALGAGGGAGGAGGGGGAGGAGGSGGSGGPPAWTQACVDLAIGLCNTTCDCSHSVCAQGGDLDPGCNPCAAAVCEADAYCCDNTWDGLCVDEAQAICGLDCQ